MNGDEKQFQLTPLIIAVSHSSDVSLARCEAKAMAMTIGFDERSSEEIVIAVSELASNVVKHAKSGTLTLTPLNEDNKDNEERYLGIQIESHNSGPIISDVEQAMTDGFSTSGSLGYGLGAVNRLMDEFDITSQPGHGTRISCKKWLKLNEPMATPCPLDFGAATRPHPGMAVNGDAFVIKRWNEQALVGVIDGLGHGQWAQRAAQTARHYVESHFSQPLADIFRGVGRVCYATRGVVMALARFNWKRKMTKPDQSVMEMGMEFASIGNVEARIFGSPEPMNFIVRRGVIGLNAPNPVVTEHPWKPGFIMVLHSDGLKSNWRRENFPQLMSSSALAAEAAHRLLSDLVRDDDDATVIVVK